MSDLLKDAENAKYICQVVEVTTFNKGIKGKGYKVDLKLISKQIDSEPALDISEDKVIKTVYINIAHYLDRIRLMREAEEELNSIKDTDDKTNLAEWYEDTIKLKNRIEWEKEYLKSFLKCFRTGVDDFDSIEGIIDSIGFLIVSDCITFIDTDENKEILSKIYEQLTAE